MKCNVGPRSIILKTKWFACTRRLLQRLLFRAFACWVTSALHSAWGSRQLTSRKGLKCNPIENRTFFSLCCLPLFLSYLLSFVRELFYEISEPSWLVFPAAPNLLLRPSNFPPRKLNARRRFSFILWTNKSWHLSRTGTGEHSFIDVRRKKRDLRAPGQPASFY